MPVILNGVSVTGGKTVKTDTIAGQEAQIIKLMLGAAGVDGGLIGPTNPLPFNRKNTLVPVIWDYFALTQNATQDIYTYRTGGAGGSVVRVVTITFTDTTKAVISNVASV